MVARAAEFVFGTRDELKLKLSNEKDLGWLFDIGDYTAQLYGDYNKPL